MDFLIMNPIKSAFSFLRYWYFRYTLVTELYMVEKWEENVIHGFMLAIFGLLFVFNCKVLIPAISNLLMQQ